MGSKLGSKNAPILTTHAPGAVSADITRLRRIMRPEPARLSHACVPRLSACGCSWTSWISAFRDVRDTVRCREKAMRHRPHATAGRRLASARRCRGQSLLIARSRCVSIAWIGTTRWSPSQGDKARSASGARPASGSHRADLATLVAARYRGRHTSHPLVVEVAYTHDSLQGV
jgi:hypothetical protein